MGSWKGLSSLVKSNKPYKTGAYVSGAILIASIFLKVQFLNNLIIACFSFSFFLLFISVWLSISERDRVLPFYEHCPLSIYRACHFLLFLALIFMGIGFCLLVLLKNP